MDKQPVSPFIFTEYDKISDTLMWFGTSKYKLRFNVRLNRKDQNGKIRSFHSEFGFYNESLGKNGINISRDYTYFYTIERGGDLNGSLLLRQNDVEMLKMVIKDRIYPWFFSQQKSVYGMNQEGQLCLKRRVKPILFPLSNNNYISFCPTVIEFSTTHEYKQGLEVAINEETNSFDIDIDTFLQFASIILNTDMVNAAMNMLNYVKVKPYRVNYRESENGESTKGFFR
jgi:hypothetical protein